MGEAVSKGRKAAVVAIIGRPSAGKSTLLNALCGHKIAIVSPVPQTTRNRIRGVVTESRGQLVFIDTPGFHDSDRRFNRHMKSLVDESIRDADFVLYVVDVTRSAGAEEQAIADRAASGVVVVALNKIDAATATAREARRDAVAAAIPGARIVATSGRTGEGLAALRDALFDASPSGDQLYPGEFYTDQPPEFRVAEIIREKAIDGMREEVPHALYVDIADMELREAPGGGRELLWIRAFVVVERESQVGIVVGHGGSRIKEIRTASQREIAALFPYRIHLDLRVKSNPKWRSDERLLARLVH